MNSHTLIYYMTANPTIMILIPAAILCYIPMWNQTRRKPWRIILCCAALFIATYVLTLWIGDRYPNLDGTVMLLPFLGIFFVYYALSVRADFTQCAGVFFLVCALMAIASYSAYIIDAAMGGSMEAAKESGIFASAQIGLAVLITILSAAAFWKWGRFLVDNLRNRMAWSLLAIISGLVFAILSVTAPQQHQKFFVEGVGSTLLLVYILVSAMFVLIVYFFMHVSMTLIREDELREQETVYRMQRKQYLQLQEQTEQIRIVRHDFRHTINLLQRLAEQDDMDGIRDYLKQYEESIPTPGIRHYCDNDLINAALNFHEGLAEESQIRTKFQVELPAISEAQTFDLVTLLSNLVENSRQGCETVPPEERRIQLRIATVNEENLYIVVSNTFDGHVRREGGRYLSTRRRQGGRGIGLRSIRRTAEKYDGEAKFYHEGKLFHADITLKIEPEEPIVNEPASNEPTPNEPIPNEPTANEPAAEEIT